MARRVPVKTRKQTARARIKATAASTAPPAEIPPEPDPDDPDALTLLTTEAEDLMKQARAIPMTADLLREMSGVEWAFMDKPIRAGGVSFHERVKRLKAQIARERSGA